jgi:lipopolysaccharide assembly outer membrane protein LptD (OstA)
MKALLKMNSKLILYFFLCQVTFVTASRLELVNAEKGELIHENGRELRKLEGNVHLRQGDAYLYCNLAYFDMTDNRATLLQHVEIYDGEHRLKADMVIYDGNRRVESAFGHIQLFQENQTLESDTLIYNQINQEAHATGNVNLADFLESTVLSGNDILYERNKEVGIASGNPQLVRMDSTGQDSLIIRSKLMQVWGERQVAMATEQVSIQRGEWRANCDLAKFHLPSKCLVLYENPEIFEGNRHIQGDSIKIFLVESVLDSGIIYGHASIRSANRSFEDQLNGKQITFASADSNRVIIVKGEAESSYHVFNDKDEWEGLNRINGDRITLEFSGDELIFVDVQSQPGESQGEFVPAQAVQRE